MDSDLERWLKKEGEEFLQAVGIKRDSVVLDFGCRRGTYAIPVARLVGPAGKVYAVDKNRDVLDELTQTVEKQGLSNIECIDTGGEVSVPIADETVDVVLLYDVIHLIGWEEGEQDAGRRSTAVDRRRLLTEMHRVVRPGGLLSVYMQHLDTHTDATSEDEIRSEIEAAGFRYLADVHHDLIHDDNRVRGHVVNFTRNP